MSNDIGHSTSSLIPVRSGNTKIKVAAGYFLLLALVFSLVIITYKSFYSIIDSVESLSHNNDESSLVENISSGINEIRTSSKVYSLTFKSSDYKIYRQQTRSVFNLIDSLDLQLTRQLEYDKADSLNAIFQEYIISINKWLKLKKADNADDFGRITEIIEEQDDSLTQSIDNAPYSTTTTVTRLVEKPVNEDSLAILIPGQAAQDKTFFQKIFGTRKKNRNNLQDKIHVNQKITTQTTVEVDTGYYNQVDMLLSKVKKTLTHTENKNNLRRIQLARLEILLLNYQADLVTKINSLLKNIEEGNRTTLNKKIVSSKQTARKASQILLYVELIALIVTLIFMYVIFKDLTKSAYYKRMLEKEKLETEKLARTKEEFLTMMSHEIRTPLTNIVGLTEQLENGSDNADHRHQIHSIVNSSEHLLAIVNDFLDYSKIEYGTLTFEKIGFNLQDIISEVIDILRIKADQKCLHLYSQAPDDLKDLILAGDPVRLKQILINLAGNSIKFTEKGFIKIETSVTEKQQAYWLKCSVTDTGIGIEKDRLDTIFTDYSQADPTITRKYGGTGLGLSISKKIVEMQKGTIQVQSEPGKGSVFSFEIPFQKGSENEYKPKYNATYGEQLKNINIIIIDDDEMMPMLLEPMLRNWSMHYTFCNSSIKAWNLLQQNVYDIIMLDIQMLEMDGYELVRRIKTNNSSRNLNSKIIICTANVASEIDNTSSLVRDNFVLLKPFKKAELWNVLCKSMDINDILEHIPNARVSGQKPGSYSLSNFKTYANEDPDTLVLFINTFISQTRSELEEMKSHFLQNNYRQVREIAHKLKNTFGQLEAHDLLAILLYLENLPKDNILDPDEIEAQIQKLQQSCYRLFAGLEEEIQHLISS